ncbi:hypothetical protein U14_01459 [Candidatus Moduliflexus flocculans]|uniref:Uncharacterized protein n=1 Tax=Candidatus Moduliflexus flocculans TaxID=1499966 RepID=A0A0S6VS42_9BACT|nr:hypothetical protein U14_01459 [Candidatus Moduliflexus flocculans]
MTVKDAFVGRISTPFSLWKKRLNESLPDLINRFVIMPFLRLGTRSILGERTAHSIESIGNVAKKYEEGYSVIIIPSHPMARRHTLGMMLHCMNISKEISGQYPHVVLATDEITFVYIKIRVVNELIQRFYRFIGTLGGHIMLSRKDPNSAFRAGIDIARLLRNQSTVVMAGEGYPRHDSRRYVDIPNSVEFFYTKLKSKNILPPSVSKTSFVDKLVRDIQALVDREDKQSYRSGKLSDHAIDSIKQMFLRHIPVGQTMEVDDVVEELLMSWGERFGRLQGIDPVLGVTVQPRHKAMILPIVFTEYSKNQQHIDVRDYFLIDNASYTEVKSSMREMDMIQRCNIAFEMVNDQRHADVIASICQFCNVIYTPTHALFEEYHAGKLPFQELYAVILEKIKTPRNPLELQQAEGFRDYLNNFKIAAEIAGLDDEDRLMLRDAIKLNIGDLEQVIPSVRIRQAWKQQEMAAVTES